MRSNETHRTYDTEGKEGGGRGSYGSSLAPQARTLIGHKNVEPTWERLTPTLLNVTDMNFERELKQNVSKMKEGGGKMRTVCISSLSLGKSRVFPSG